MAEESALLGSRRVPDGRPLAGEPPAPERVADRIEPDEVRYDGDVTPRVSALQAAVEAPREEATAPPRWWAEAAMRS